MNFNETMELYRMGKAYMARRDGEPVTQHNPDPQPSNHQASAPADFTDLVVARMMTDRGRETQLDLGDAVMARRKARRADIEGEELPGELRGPNEVANVHFDLGDAVMARRRARRDGTEGDPRDFTASVVARMRADRGHIGSEHAEKGRVVPPSADALARTDGSDAFLVGPRLGGLLRDIHATPQQVAEFSKFRAGEASRRQRARDDGTPLALTVAGDQARVSVRGMLTEVPDLWAWILGEPNTLYSDIAEAIAHAERDPKIRQVTFDIESGGGTVAGLRTATSAIRAMKKSRSVTSSFAASAAYWIAAEVGRIEAKHDLSEFGSIGVAVRQVKLPVVHDIANTNAPNKRPDPTTEEGKAAIRRELDAIHQVFATDVAAGRSRALGSVVTVEQVNAQFGQGGMLLAGEALRRKLIDGIA